MSKIEKLAYDLISSDDIKALSDADLVAVFCMVCRRKKPMDRAAMELRIACDISAWRRRFVAARRAPQ